MSLKHLGRDLLDRGCSSEARRARAAEEPENAQRSGGCCKYSEVLAPDDGAGIHDQVRDGFQRGGVQLMASASFTTAENDWPGEQAAL
jgi:hypothetical protein